MRRYDCLEAIAPLVADSLVITNLANTATEWRSVRPHEGNLYFVGMGMVTPYAAGLAMALPHRRVQARVRLAEGFPVAPADPAREQAVRRPVPGPGRGRADVRAVEARGWPGAAPHARA